MKRATPRCFLALLLAAFASVAVPVAVAAETAAPASAVTGLAKVQDPVDPAAGPGHERDETKRVVSPRAGRLLIEATELFGEERLDEAEKVLNKLRRLNPYESALASRMQAYIAFARDDTDAAIGHLEAALKDGALPRADHADVLFQVARLQATRQDWKGVVSSMTRWFVIGEDPNTTAYHLLALAYYQMGNLEAALAPAQLAVAVAEKPHQSAIQLLLAIYLTRKDYAAATPVLVELLTHYPDSGTAYWLQLTSLYGVRNDLEHALAVLEIADRQGLLSEDADYRRLAQLQLHQGVPHRAAQRIEQALADKQIAEDTGAYELLNSGWILARETKRAAKPLARAAELAKNGDLYIRLAQIHMLEEDWAGAAAALRQALEKGGLGDPGSAQLLLGVAYFNSDQFLEARSWFGRAQQSAGTREQAETWLLHVQRELETDRSGAHTPG